MTAEKQDSPKMISTPTLLVLVGAVALLGYLFVQPMFAPKGSEAAPAKEKKPVAAAANQGPVALANNGSAVVQPLTPQEIPGLQEVTDADLAGRDPFLPSELMLAKLASQSAPKPDVKPDDPKVEDVPKFEPKVDKKPEPSEKPPENGIIWKGVVGSSPNQLVMIQRGNRTYNLNIGETLPGTQYILTEVNKDSILLISPDDQKRLYRKKEAK